MNNTDQIADNLICQLEAYGATSEADGVRVVRNHLNPDGFDEGVNEERERIFVALISQELINHRYAQAEGMRRFRERLKSQRRINESD
jgi:hypothetical protein